jgi:hypothetical protein
MSFSKIFQNKFVLNFVFILSLLTFFGNLIYGNFNAVAYFVLLGWLTSFFSNNMAIVLAVPLILVNVYTRFIEPKYKKEGLENNRDASNNDLTDQQKIEVMKQKNTNSNSSSNSGNSLPITPMNDDTTTTTTTNDETFTNNKKKKYNIDYASTVEEAYDNLNQVIGGEGIKNLTKDTQRLMKQQLQLTEALKGMGPLMESMGPLLGQANTLLKSFGGAESLQGINDLANNLSAK